MVDSDGDRAKVRTLAAARSGDMELCLAEIQRVRTVLAELIAACSGHRSVRACPIVEALSSSFPMDPPVCQGPPTLILIGALVRREISSEASCRIKGQLPIRDIFHDRDLMPESLFVST
jgi:hypothetical protein